MAELKVLIVLIIAVLFIVQMGILAIVTYTLAFLKNWRIKVMADLSKLKDEVDATVAAEEKILTKIQDLETQIANSTDQATIDALTAELAAERAKLEAQP